MKIFLCLFLCCTFQGLYAQSILIPYQKNNLFGLSDVNGKMIIGPSYNKMRWLQGSWFETGKKIALADTLETKPNRLFIRNTTIELTGLVHNGKIILADEPFDAYEIIANKCIVSKADTRVENLTKEQFKKYADKRRFYSLFNLAGKNLYPDNFKRIQKIDTAGLSGKVKGSGRYILFMVVNFQDQRSLFVFDADKQEISDWLIKDAAKLEADQFSSNQQQKRIVFKVTDGEFNVSTRLIDYSTGKFIMTSTAGRPSTKDHAGYGTGNSGDGPGRGERMVEVTTNSMEDNYNVVPPPPEPRSASKPPFRRYHQLIKDSLFYITGQNERTAIQLAPNATIILREPRGINQYDPVMARLNDKFYIIPAEQPGNIAYDSLIYFGKYFIAWQQINGRSRAGVIEADGSIVVPMIYDSLYAGIPFFDFVDKNPAGKSAYQPVLKEADSKYNYEKRNPYLRAVSDRLTVFIDGKCGVVNLKGDSIIPIMYQLIAQNNLGHSRPREDNFILLKKDNQYGLTRLSYSQEKKRDSMSFTIPPKFKYIPGYFYPNYYDIKGYVLVGFYDEQYIFKGFGNATGKEYF